MSAVAAIHRDLGLMRDRPCAPASPLISAHMHRSADFSRYTSRAYRKE